jgi:hypothetical protein
MTQMTQIIGYKIQQTCSDCPLDRQKLEQLLDRFLVEPEKWLVDRKGHMHTDYYHFEDVFIKEITTINPNDSPDIFLRNYREAEVSMLVNELKSPFLNHTHDYYIRPGIFDDIIVGIVSCYVPGINLKDFLIDCEDALYVIDHPKFMKYRDESSIHFRNLDREELLRTVREIFLLQLIAIGSLVKTGKFTHYDALSHNFIIEALSEPVTYHLEWGQRVYSITLPYRITVIDFARSYVDGVSAQYAQGFFDDAITPGIYDPHFDLAWLFAYISFWLEDFGIDDLLERNGFQRATHEIANVPGYPRDTCWLFRDIPGPVETNGFDSEYWAATTPRDLSIEELRTIFREMVIKELKRRRFGNLSMDDFDSEIRRYFEFYRLMLPTADCQRFAILWGEVMAARKLAVIAARPDSPEEFFAAGWDWLSRISSPEYVWLQSFKDL